MLRRVDSARVTFAPSIFGKGPVHLVVGRRVASVGQRKWKRAQKQQFDTYQATWPAFLAEIGGRRYWSYRDRIYSENEGLDQQQVHALLLARDHREQRKVDRAVAMMTRGYDAPAAQRGVIADEVKQFIWQRDGGRCRNCQSTTELQFDHVIPIAMGGSSEPENLQLLCGPCNRRKGAGLTVQDHGE